MGRGFETEGRLTLDNRGYTKAIAKSAADTEKFATNGRNKMGQFSASMSKAEQQTGKLSKGMGLLKGAIAAVAVQRLGSALFGLAEVADNVNDLRAGFDSLAKSTGLESDAIERLNVATLGQIKTSDTLAISNKLIAAGSVTSASQLELLGDAAVRLGKSVGKGPTEAFERLAKGVAEGSTRAFKEFGISVENLDLKDPAAIFDRIAESAAKLPPISADATTGMLQLEKQFEDVQTAIGTLVSPALLSQFSSLAESIGRITAAGQAMAARMDEGATSTSGFGVELIDFGIALEAASVIVVTIGSGIGALVKTLVAAGDTFGAMGDSASAAFEMVSIGMDQALGFTGPLAEALGLPGRSSKENAILMSAAAVKGATAGLTMKASAETVGSAWMSAAEDVHGFMRAASPELFHLITGDVGTLGAATVTLGTATEGAAVAANRERDALAANTDRMRENTEATLQNAAAKAGARAASSGGGFGGIERDFGVGQGIIVGGAPVSGPGVVNAGGGGFNVTVNGNTSSPEETAAVVASRMATEQRSQFAGPSPLSR